MIQKILNWFVDTKIYDILYQRQQTISNVLLMNTHEIANDIIRCIIFDDPNHQELYKRINDNLTKIHTSNSPPLGRYSYYTYFEYLWNVPLGEYDNKYPRFPISHKKAYIKVKKIYKNICRDLSKGQLKDIKEYVYSSN